MEISYLANKMGYATTFEITESFLYLLLVVLEEDLSDSQTVREFKQLTHFTNHLSWCTKHEDKEYYREQIRKRMYLRPTLRP